MRRLLGVPFFLLLCLASSSLCQEGDLEAVLTSLARRPRTGGPVLVDAELRWGGARLLHGRLEVTLMESNKVLGRLVTDDLTLTTGVQRIRMLLPAMTAFSGADRPRARLRFLTEDRVLDGGHHALPLPLESRRSLVIGLCGPEDRVDNRLKKIGSRLFLEHYLPENSSGDLPAGSLDTLASGFARLNPDGMPTSPLEYCAFDLLLMESVAFSRLRRTQVSALVRWIEAGGSFCLLAEIIGGLKSYHLDCLNQLANREGLDYALTPSGDITLTEVTGTVYSLHHGKGSAAAVLPPHFLVRLPCELGRTVLVHGSLDLDSDAWRKAVAFLWKIRRGYLSVFGIGQNWGRVRTDQDFSINASDDENAPLDYSAHPLPSSNLLTLMPGEIRLVPYWIYFLVLGSFILVIWPLEYGIARLFRSGWLTWIVFPLACIGATVLMMDVSRHYLGGDSRRSLVLVDVGKDGKELRRTRLELLYQGDDREVVFDLRRCLFSPVDVGKSFLYYGGAFQNGGITWDGDPPRVEGQYPTGYRLRQRNRQWTPQINSFLTLQPRPPHAGIDWKAVDAAVLGSGESGPELRRAVRLEPVHIEVHFDHGSPTVVSKFPEPPDEKESPHESILELIWAITQPPLAGLLAVAHRTSPAGGDSFEDLALRDPSDAGQKVLLILTAEGDDYVAYRRLYTTRDLTRMKNR